MVGGWTFRDGDAALRRDDDRHDWPGRGGRHALRAVLLRSAAGHGDPRRDHRAVDASRESVHGVRVSRTAVRCQDALAHRVSFPVVARHVVRNHSRCARRRVLRGVRMAAGMVCRAHGRADRALHDDRRRAGRDMGGRQADGTHRRGDRRDGHRAAHPHSGLARRGAAYRRRGRTHARVRLLVQPHEHLHLLVRDHRRHLSHALVFRYGPEPGAAVSHGALGERGAELAADQCLLEDPASGDGPAHRRAGVRVLHVPAATAAVQSVARAARARRAAGRVCRARGTLRRGAGRAPGRGADARAGERFWRRH